MDELQALFRLLKESNAFDESQKYGLVLNSLTENLRSLVGLLLSSEQEIYTLKQSSESFMVEIDELKSKISSLEERNAKKSYSAVEIETLQSRLSRVYHESEIGQEDKIDIMSLMLHNHETETVAKNARYDAHIKYLENQLDQAISLVDTLADLIDQHQLEGAVRFNQAVVDNHLLQSYLLGKKVEDPSARDLEYIAVILKYESRIDDLIRGNRSAAAYYKNAINEWQTSLVTIERLKREFQAPSNIEARYEQLVVDHHLLFSFQNFAPATEVSENKEVDFKYNQLLLEYHLLFSLYSEALENSKASCTEFKTKVSQVCVDQSLTSSRSIPSYCDSQSSESQILHKRQESVEHLLLLYEQTKLENNLLLSQVAELNRNADAFKRDYEKLAKEADETRNSLISARARLRARDSYLSNRFVIVLRISISDTAKKIAALEKQLVFQKELNLSLSRQLDMEVEARKKVELGPQTSTSHIVKKPANEINTKRFQRNALKQVNSNRVFVTASKNPSEILLASGRRKKYSVEEEEEIISFY